MANKKTIKETETKEETAEIFKIPSPKELYDYLNEYVIGQEQAKKVLSVAVYNHYKRLMVNLMGLSLPNESEEMKDVGLDKTNILMNGNSGSGKTFMIKMIAKKLGVPCYIGDCTKLSETGYVGEDPETMITGLLRECNYNVQLAQMGIIALDEVDKLARKSDSASITRDVSGEGVQQCLLKIVEGSKVNVPPNGGRKHPEAPTIEVDTSNILFIGMGAFDGLDKIVERRMNTNRIGFNNYITKDKTNNEDVLDNVTSDDLKSFGFIPEFIGRFPVVTHTNPLSKDDLKRILIEPKNSIVKQYQRLLSFDNVSVSFTDDALDMIAEKALENKTGARGLKKIIEEALFDIMFEYGANTKSKKITITKEYLVNNVKMFKEYKKAA